ncbi:glutathione peroxidase [Helcococcus kunzii]|uniref:glutathione peroxidase n=1 Tax=Helcococcus kunzii TaxID=40091 RepID=UPI0021A85165|nr:glutathione peroxidase [Helcococcus kunzii]MCT1796647.1 glutathione peroxidase [Helcococcus kunzii]MCT1988709.1 glutathione peroxidase [Helcococcus kunzii]
MTSIYDFKVEDINGDEFDFNSLKNKVVLIVNTASKCGFTPQFEGLENLYKKYKDQGFTVIGFPCNQFGGQDPAENSKIASFCQLNYGVTFPMMAKIKVNGKEEHPLYTYLKSQQGGILGERIKWNFTKFLISRQGEVVARFAPKTKPEEINGEIEELL